MNFSSFYKIPNNNNQKMLLMCTALFIEINKNIYNKCKKNIK